MWSCVVLQPHSPKKDANFSLFLLSRVDKKTFNLRLSQDFTKYTPNEFSVLRVAQIEIQIELSNMVKE